MKEYFDWVGVANKNNIIKAFVCDGCELGILQFATAHNDIYLKHQYSKLPYSNHHTESHAGSLAFDDAHKCFIQDVVDIATTFKNINTTNGKTLLDEVLIFVTSDLGEFAAEHNGINIPCFILGGDKNIFKYNQFIDLTGNGSGDVGSLNSKSGL